MEANTATIISGFLSMAGGAAGAFGAYYVATMQMKKQFRKQDIDRVIELRIIKLNESLELTNEFLHILQIWRRLTSNVEMRVTELQNRGYTHVVEPSIFRDNERDEIKKNIQKLVSIKDTLKKNKIFLTGITDLEKIYISSDEVVESNTKFNNLFNGFKLSTSLELAKLGQEFDKVMSEISGSYSKLDKELCSIITLIENAIKELLDL